MTTKRFLILAHQYPNQAFPYEGGDLSAAISAFSNTEWEPTILVWRDLLPNTLYLSMTNGVMDAIRTKIKSHRLEDKGHDVYYQPYVRFPKGQDSNYAFWESWVRWQVAPRIRWLHHRYQFQAILGFGVMVEGGVAVQMGHRLGMPALTYGLGSEVHSYRRSSKNDTFMKKVVAGATINIMGSAEMKTLLKKMAPNACVYNWPTSIDMTHLSPLNNPTHLGEGHHIAFVAIHRPVKNSMLSVRAFAKLYEYRQDVHLHVAGDGYTLPQMKAFIAEHNLNHAVTFYGNTPRDKVREIMSGMDLLILTSHKEGAPRIILEAQSMGKPAVATHVGGVPDLITSDEVGYMVPANDADAMAKAIDKALGASWNAQAIRAHALQFSPAVFAQKVAGFLDEAVDRWQNAGNITASQLITNNLG